MYLRNENLHAISAFTTSTILFGKLPDELNYLALGNLHCFGTLYSSAALGLFDGR